MNPAPKAAPANEAGGAESAKKAITRKVRYVMRQKAVQEVAALLSEAKIPGLLIKGFGLAATSYDKPWQRDMADVDILLPRDLWNSAIAILRNQYGKANVPSLKGRSYSQRWLGEQGVLVSFGSTSVLIELHNSVDKVSPRPIPFYELYSRAVCLPELPGTLRPPDTEDQVLLTIAHLGNSQFQHEPGWRDLELLIHQGLHWDVIVERARRYKLDTCLYVGVQTLQRRGIHMDGLWLEKLQPSPLRKRMIARFLRDQPAKHEPRERPTGLRWIAEQSLLRDDIGWLFGVGRYALLRIIDRLEL